MNEMPILYLLIYPWAVGEREWILFIQGSAERNDSLTEDSLMLTGLTSLRTVGDTKEMMNEVSPRPQR